MADPARRLAADVGGLLARDLLRLHPELQAALSEGDRAWVDARIVLERTKAGKVRLRYAMSGVKVARRRSTAVVVPIDDPDQETMFPR